MSSLRVLCYLFFFFKQKTAYEMRISDWSSDVCSSDLVADAGRGGRLRHRGGGRALREGRRGDDRNEREREHDQNEPAEREPAATHLTADARLAEQHRRSEEHTSELQSLMRISYAVFCLKTKTTNISVSRMPSTTQQTNKKS